MIKIDSVEVFSRILCSEFSDTVINQHPLRYALELIHAVILENSHMPKPSLEIGIHDGVSSSFINYFRSDFTYGGDMPSENTWESQGLVVDPRFDQYQNYVYLNMEELPFRDCSFSTLYTSETMFYGMHPECVLPEFYRVLKPSGTAYVFNATDTWEKYPTLLGRHRESIPSIRVWSRQRTLEILKGLGAEIVMDRYFLSSALEALLQALGGPIGDLLRVGMVKFPDAGDIVRRTIEDYIRIEMALPDGPADSFHHAFAFRKPGAGGLDDVQDEVPKLACVTCRSTEFSTSHETCRCSSCGSQFPVINGIPFITSDPERAFSPKRGGVSGRSAVPQQAIDQLDGMFDPSLEFALSGNSQLAYAAQGMIALKASRTCHLAISTMGPLKPGERSRSYVQMRDIRARTKLVSVVLIKEASDQIIEKAAASLLKMGLAGRSVILSVDAPDGPFAIYRSEEVVGAST